MKIKRRKTHPVTFWHDHVREWQQSGQKQATYCRGQGLRQSQFGYWVRKSNKQAVHPEQFVEVSREAVLPARVFAFELEISGGIKLRLDRADPEILKSVLQAVRGAAC